MALLIHLNLILTWQCSALVYTATTVDCARNTRDRDQARALSTLRALRLWSSIAGRLSTMIRVCDSRELETYRWQCVCTFVTTRIHLFGTSADQLCHQFLLKHRPRACTCKQLPTVRFFTRRQLPCIVLNCSRIGHELTHIWPVGVAVVDASRLWKIEF